MIRLYADAFWISPYVFTCFVALREKGVAFEVTEVSLGEGEHQRERYRDQSVTGRVPALEHDDFWLAESSAIADYLEEAFPPPKYAALLPSGLRERARARQIMAWVRSDLGALREERSTATMFYERADKPLSASGRAAAEKLVHVVELLLPAGATTLFGDWSIADADLAFMLHRLLLNGHELPAAVRGYAEAQRRRPSVSAFFEHERRAYVPY